MKTTQELERKLAEIIEEIKKPDQEIKIKVVKCRCGGQKGYCEC